jgi:AcrR family transcriptional regulator
MTRSSKVRRYRLGRRAEAAEETRRRIVRATFDLHAEQGIAGTTMPQIAERAEVSVGTVYHHFPTYADAIAACGAFTAEHVPSPDECLFAGLRMRAEKVQALVQAFFQYYERLPALASVRSDQALAPALKQFAAEEARRRLALSAKAIGCSVRGRKTEVLAALIDFDVHRAFVRQGFTTADATDVVTALAEAWLDKHDGDHRTNTKRKA